MNTRDTFRRLYKGVKTSAFTPRIPFLQSLNGKKFIINGTVDEDKLAMEIGLTDMESIKWLFKLNGLDMKSCIQCGKVGERTLGKWLKSAHIPEAMISRICAAKIPGCTLTLSTRYKDFVRMSATRHFSSCLRIDKDKFDTIPYYLHKSNVFLMLNRDEQGEFKTRVIGRLVKVKVQSDAQALSVKLNSLVILFNKPYSSVKIKMPDSLEGIPCFTQASSFVSSFTSTVISNHLVSYDLATDNIYINRRYNGVFDDLVSSTMFNRTVMLDANRHARDQALPTPRLSSSMCELIQVCDQQPYS